MQDLLLAGLPGHGDGPALIVLREHPEDVGRSHVGPGRLLGWRDAQASREATSAAVAHAAQSLCSCVFRTGMRSTMLKPRATAVGA
jgi:hypothetical protein